MHRRSAVPLLLAVILAGMDRASPIPERDYGTQYGHTIPPFLKSGERFPFRSADGRTELQGVRFLNPQARGTIVVVNGSTESWLKYGELFHDLYRAGYSIFSYDHRGQGLSPHLVPANPQIDHIDDFALYAADLDAFVREVVLPTRPSPLFLIAHSMGGGVTTDYLQRYPSPFQAVVLSAPMIRIKTSPYPEPVAHLMIKLLHAAGFGAGYAPGKHDHDPKESFEGNPVTSSRERWEANEAVWTSHPDAVLGGPSVDWVNQALDTTATIRGHKEPVPVPVLVFQAGQDAFVMNPSRSELHRIFPNVRIICFPDSKHEILMERDAVRDKAIGEIAGFFGR